jgi:hypothetical protein
MPWRQSCNCDPPGAGPSPQEAPTAAVPQLPDLSQQGGICSYASEEVPETERQHSCRSHSEELTFAERMWTKG